MKHSKNKFYLSAITVVALLSCNVTKPYQQPGLNLPQQYKDIAYSDTASIANISWEDFFTDATLKSLIKKGIDYNFDLQVAVNRIEIARQQLLQAKNLQLPTLSGTVSGQYNRPSENSLNGSFADLTGSKHYEDYIVGLNLSWEADIWGKLRSQKKAALLQYLQTYEAKKTVQTQLIADIADGYYNLLMLDEQLRIANASLALADSTLQQTQLLKDAGETNALSVEQTKAQRETTALLIPQLQEQISLQENALSQLTGQLPQSIERQAQLSDIQLPQQLNAGVPAAVVSHRPDVRSAEMNIEIANQKVGIAQANMYPNLNITANGGLESLKASNWFNIPSSLFGIVSGSLVQPIFGQRTLKTNYEVAKTEREQAVIKFRQSVVGAVTDVSNSLVQLNKLSEQEKIASSQVATLARATDNASMLYKSGMANYLEVITAQNNSLQAQLNLASTHCQQLIAAVSLYKSLGGGWQ
ncbi:RND transporter [Arachidicoccus ginsenosidimutans]|uniref:efflux transporter outer membrane subunit n=1 Tax=Arachidicoccus sp. BS20 TaxID=1850526 RepID=UPI0007F06C56|nr:efflux transporter outer membrane subunit [Arachidicoccus sp. BS20]ANI90291.1 RND transporter [Arachidicoccus sp. BS20]